ncbi:tail fiber domain-containing protein [Fulvivirgaceae bacterium BMA12]|uniref:Tail fiber domain-containing protein n=1 Tax=Agaribacillus aureus TaxID=3051825 RepID=A0ABT8L740_9BACT|nr:tail fiber domain-containing protein [Fulvivirgaceae bacterium BMA12]
MRNSKIPALILSLFLFWSQPSFSQQWTGSSGSTGNISREGNVSIGTTTSGAKLRVDADSALGLLLERNNNIYTDTQARIGISSNNLGGPGLRLSISSNNGSTFLDGIFLHENTNVGIGNTTPSQKLHVSGSVLANSYLTSSDKRYKKNIRKVENSTSKLTLLRGVQYNMDQGNFQSNGFTAQNKIGLIAQEVKKVFPELVHEDAKGFLSVDYISLIPVIIEALKEQNQTIANQQNQILALENKLSAVDKNNLLQQRLEPAMLEQNSPNPFDQNTEIRYSLPANSAQATIFIYDLSGKQLINYALSSNGQGSVSIGAGELEAGLYIYSLVVDGKEVASRRMILTK